MIDKNIIRGKIGSEIIIKGSFMDFSDLKLELSEGSNLVLRLANFKENSEINIYGKVGKNAGISVVFALISG